MSHTAIYTTLMLGSEDRPYAYAHRSSENNDVIYLLNLTSIRSHHRIVVQMSGSLTNVETRSYLDRLIAEATKLRDHVDAEMADKPELVC